MKPLKSSILGLVTNFCLLPLAIILFLPSCGTATGHSGPYDSSKPLTRWWWFASEIQKPDIAAQLDWLKEQGFGGVEVAWIYPLNRMQRDTVNITPRQKWLGPEWSDVVEYTKRYGDSLGLTVDFTFGSLWPFGDLQVKPGESTRVFGDTAFRQWITASWDYPKKGLVIDHLSKPAFEHYAGRMGKALEPAMKTGRPSGIFVDSWEVDTHNLWTTGFDSIFKARFGYDIVPYMKEGILNPDFAGQRYDYMKLVSDRVINGFYIPFTEEAHQLGGYSRGQCAGSPTDLISAYAAMDVPETEAMLYEPYYSRIVASAAVLAGRPVVTSETFTCLYGWPREHMREERVTDLKMVADALFANGVNQIIWHGTPYNPIGSDSISFYATVHVGRAGALSPHLKSFNRYLEEVSKYMRKGKPFTDVAVYLPLEDAWIAGEMPKEKQLPWAWGWYEFRYAEVPEEIRGWQPMWINQKFLEQGKRQKAEGKNREKESGIMIQGAEFRSLWVDAKYLDYETLKTIEGLAEGGLPVCLKQKPMEAGYFKHPDYEGLAEKLVSLSSSEWSENAVGKPVVEGNDLPYFWCRKDGDKYYIFFAHPVAREFVYPVKYGQADVPEVQYREVTIHVAGHDINLKLAFHEYESLLLEVATDGSHRFIDLPRVD
jgi:hypothetical protein